MLDGQKSAISPKNFLCVHTPQQNCAHTTHGTQHNKKKTLFKVRRALTRIQYKTHFQERVHSLGYKRAAHMQHRRALARRNITNGGGGSSSRRERRGQRRHCNDNSLPLHALATRPYARSRSLSLTPVSCFSVFSPTYTSCTGSLSLSLLSLSLSRDVQ